MTVFHLCMDIDNFTPDSVGTEEKSNSPVAEDRSFDGNEQQRVEGIQWKYEYRLSPLPPFLKYTTKPSRKLRSNRRFYERL